MLVKGATGRLLTTHAYLGSQIQRELCNGKWPWSCVLVTYVRASTSNSHYWSKQRYSCWSNQTRADVTKSKDRGFPTYSSNLTHLIKLLTGRFEIGSQVKFRNRKYIFLWNRKKWCFWYPLYMFRNFKYVFIIIIINCKEDRSVHSFETFHG